MKHLLPLAIAALCGLLLGAGSVSAKGKGQGKGHGKGKPSKTQKGKPGKGPAMGKGHKDKGSTKGMGAKDKGPGREKKGDWRTEGRYRTKDRSDCISYWDQYKGHPHGLPPGLAKNLRRGKPLPPGWDKKLRAGWIIDDSWWGHFKRVPGNYLPGGLRQPKDTGVFLFGDRLVRVHKPTREVVDSVRIPTIRR